MAVLGHDERQQILIDHAGVLGAVGLDGVLRRGELAALAEDVGLPSGLDHRPVGLIAVHRDDHTAAAGGNFIGMRAVIQAGQHIFELLHVLERARRRDVAAVEQDVAVDARQIEFTRLFQHRDQVRNIGMDVAVGQQAEEMQRMTGLRVVDQLQPRLRLEQRAGFDGLLHELRALRVDLAAAEGVVADFAVAHVVIGGQTDGGAVGFEPRHGAGRHQAVEHGRLCLRHGIAGAAVAAANAIHNDQYDRFFHRYDLHLRELFFCVPILHHFPPVYNVIF